MVGVPFHCGTYHLNYIISRNIFMKKLLATLLLAGSAVIASADNQPFTYNTNLFDANNSNTLGLSMAPGAETVTVFSPTDDTDKFANGIVMIAFKGALYCMWQSSAKDEDAADTWVAYSRSTDEGKTWSKPMVIAEDIPNGYCSSGGWHATEETLVAYINTWPDGMSPKGGYTRYVTSTDGLTWTKPADVLMADGTPIKGIFEQDPHVLPNGRIVNAAHMQPGLKVKPIYTDDPLGVSGWKEGKFKYSGTGDQSRELEPSLYRKADGTLVMIFRDQNSSYKKMAATSSDNGETWTNAVITNFPDARTKQSAGNLPDGTAYFACNPVNNKTRLPLALVLSKDGNHFDKAYLLRSSNEIPNLRYEGKAKRAGYHYPKSTVYNGNLYVAYATNKEDVQYTRIPLDGISMNGGSSIEGTITDEQVIAVAVYNLSGMKVKEYNSHDGQLEYNLNELGNGVYILKIKTATGVKSKKIVIK